MGQLTGFTTLLWTILLWHGVIALENGLARTPPMGWMPKVLFNCSTTCDLHPDKCIGEKLFRNVADRMVSEGYKDAGYEYIIIDSCWMETDRTADDRLIADRQRFPNGIRGVADYVHAKGLKLGIYSLGCANTPRQIDQLAIDAQTFTDWQLDYIKFDTCPSNYGNVTVQHTIFTMFGQLLRKADRPIVYSCSWPVYQEFINERPDYSIVAETCNLWPNWKNAQDSWDSLSDIISFFGSSQSRLQPYVGPGHWNDPGALDVGNEGLSVDQSKVAMAMWAILAAPLFMSNDLDAVRPEFKAILQNREIIKVNQDPLGVQGLRVSNENEIEIWTREITPIVGNSSSFAVAILNKRKDSSSVHISPVRLGLTYYAGYHMVDLYDESEPKLVLPIQNFSIFVNLNGVRFFKFTPNESGNSLVGNEMNVKTSPPDVTEKKHKSFHLSLWFFVAATIVLIFILACTCICFWALVYALSEIEIFR